jgi:hypothetical protein
MRFLAFLLLCAAALTAGCATNPDVDKTRETAVPWGRPAEWEGQLPGMGR